MARIVRELSVDEVSMVPRGANRHARVLIRKRDTGSVMGDAVKALDAAVKSIVDDDSMVSKAAKITESCSQFVEWLEQHGVDADAAEQAAGEVVAKYAAVKHEEAHVAPETVIQKVE